MISLFYLILAISNPVPGFTGEIDWSSDLCAKQRKFFQHGIEKRISIAELAAKIQKARPKVIFAGEYHTDDTALSHPSLLKSLKAESPELDCLAFEATPKDNRDGIKRVPWRSLAELAKNNYGMNSHFVDGVCGEGAEDNGKADDFLQINARNRCMARNLLGLLESKKCQQILMINGAFHLQANYLDGRPGIPARLKSLGIPVYSIFALDLSRGMIKARHSSLDAWIWPKGPKAGKSWSDLEALEPLCKDVAGAIGENYAFLTSGTKLAAKVPVAHVNSKESGTSGAWDQFDAVVMLSCPGQATGRTCGDD